MGDKLLANAKLVLYNLKQIVQITDDPETAVLKGERQGDIKVLESDCDGLALVAGHDGNVAFVGEQQELPAGLLRSPPARCRLVDTGGGVLLPGLVDAHTHPVFAGDRVDEWAMKLRGATYMEIHSAGGGIHYTVEQVRRASEDGLLEDLLQIAGRMLACGTTTVEAKSGYGLDAENEVKMLSVLHRAGGRTPLEISPTFCGAHAVPKGSTPEAAAENVCTSQLDAVCAAIASGRIRVENADVFCERGVFDATLSRRIMLACRERLPAGVRLNLHGDELSDAGAAEMAAGIGAEAVSHLEEVSAAGMSAMSRAGTVAVLLPTTAYVLKLKPPPARQMIELGVPVALGSDFNPNAYCYSMPAVMHLACTLFGLSPSEALAASTLNAAAALGRGRTHGAIAVGRAADLLLLRAPRWEHLIYRFAGHESCIGAVFKRGALVHGGV